jgi:hypothetical protein
MGRLYPLLSANVPLIRSPEDAGSRRFAAAGYFTVRVPFMPPASWPGTEQ